jgi:hypothetical protein
MGKTQSKPLAERRGMGKTGEQHGNVMVFVNQPLDWQFGGDLELAYRLQRTVLP